MRVTDLVVVGGGAIGLATGWRCARAGLSVTVCDAGKAGAASEAAGGMLGAYAEAEFDEPAAWKLSSRSLALWREFAREVEQASDLTVDYDDTGTISVAVDRDDAELLERAARYKIDRGFPVTRMTGDACRELEPLLSSAIRFGVLCKSDHQVDNRKLVGALKEALRRAGGTLQEETTVADVLVESGRVRGVRLADGREITGSRVLMSAGAWTREVGGTGPARLPVRPVKGQMLALAQPPGGTKLRHVIRAPRAYFVPKRDGRIVVGATCEEQGFDTRMTGGGVYELLRGVQETIPAGYDMELAETWMGFRPASRDSGPILGQVPGVEGLFSATGHYRNGILLTPVTALGLTNLIVNGRVADEILPFSPARFAKGG